MKEKKTAVITFRTEQWVKDILETAAEENKWSVAQTVNELCKKFVANPQPEEIIIKTADLIKALDEIKAEGEETALRLRIDLTVNEDETDICKILTFDIIENAGLGLIEGPKPISEMTREEISQVP